MNEKADKWIEDHKSEMVEALRECLKYNTLEGEPLDGMPFGKTVNDCLENTLAHAREMGFEARSLDGYCGIIDYGDGDETVGILVHLDIVPAGDGWDYDPFGAEIVGDRLYGRGAIDDKGPAYMALYALKAIKECGIKLRRKVRIILGCNEETGMRCVKYYVEHEGMPTMSFSPDGCFPVCNAEKSHFNAVIGKKYASSIRMFAGEASNVCPGKASAWIPLAVLPQNLKIPDGIRIESSPENGGLAVTAYGTQCHASLPWEGHNALQGLIYVLAQCPLPKDDLAILKGLKASFGMEYNGLTIGLNRSDYSGPFTLNFGTMRWDENGYQLVLDMRVPNDIEESELAEKLKKAAKIAFSELVDHAYDKGFVIPEDSELVEGLLDVYKQRTGQYDAKPIQMGGGTYSRTLKNAVSFGPEGFNCEASCHVANEYITMQQLDLDTKLFADAIIKLAE